MPYYANAVYSVSLTVTAHDTLHFICMDGDKSAVAGTSANTAVTWQSACFDRLQLQTVKTALLHYILLQ